jgi:hypothetical protein
VYWRELVTTAMLGTDRRDPPSGLFDDLVADTLRAVPSERMLAQVAACTAVRRAGVLPGLPADRLQPPPTDDRPVCTPAAVERWHHVTTSWPVLEDEWMLTLITNGWRVAPELVPAVLWRHRSDPVRRARAEVACGPLAGWLVSHLPDLGARSTRVTIDPEVLAELPELPIPPDLLDLLGAPGDVGAALAELIVGGELGAPHRAVIVNLIARTPTGSLPGIASALGSVESTSAGYGLASVLADLALTRHRMLDEFRRSDARLSRAPSP